MLVYYSQSKDSNDRGNLSTFSILENFENKITNNNDYYRGIKTLDYNKFFNIFIELQLWKYSINIFDINLKLLNTIKFKNSPNCIDIFEDKLAILFLENDERYIDIFDCTYDGESLNLNLINKINIKIIIHNSNFHEIKINSIFLLILISFL